MPRKDITTTNEQSIPNENTNNDVAYRLDPTVQDSPKIVEFANQAVVVWDKSLVLTEVNYSNSVALYLHYQNNTNKKVTGVSVFVSIKNPFGKIVFQKLFEDEIVIWPSSRDRNDVYWHFDDNPFISGEPFDKLWQIAENGTYEINVTVHKVVFDDGQILTAKKESRK